MSEFAAAGQRVHYQAQKLMTEAARINPQVAGIGIHAFSDGDWVVGAGVIWRPPRRRRRSGSRGWRTGWPAAAAPWYSARRRSRGWNRWSTWAC